MSPMKRTLENRCSQANGQGRVLFLACMVILALSGCARRPAVEPTDAVTYRRAPLEVSLGAWEQELPADIVLLLDQSGSMSRGRRATDPRGLRAQGSRAFVEFLAQRATRERPNRFAVVNFGSQALRVHALPLTPIHSPDDPALRTIFSKLVPMNLGDTNIVDAMRLGVQLLREGGSFDQPRNRALILFTDGEPDDARKLSRAQYFAEIAEFVRRQVAPAQIEVFVIGIDATGFKWGELEGYWQRIAGAQQVYATPNMDALKGYFNRIVQRVWKLPEVEPVVVASGRSVEFDLEPYLASAEFYIFPSQRGLTLNVYRPDGRKVQPGSDPNTPPIKRLNTFDLLVVTDPEPGRWRYEVVGGAGTVEILRNPIPLRFQLIAPQAVHPQGKPIRLIAQFKRSDGRPVASHPDYPLALTADIIPPSRKRHPVKFFLERGRNGVYVGEPPLEAPMELGEYQIVLKVSGGEKYHRAHTQRIQVKPVPYLLVDAPQFGEVVPLARRLQVRARLLQAGKPLSPQAAFTNHPDSLVLAQVAETPSGQRGEAVWLSLDTSADTPGHFAAAAPVPEAQEGRYMLAVKVAPEEKVKRAVADMTIIEFEMRPPPPPLWQRLLQGVGVVFGAGLLMALLWLLALPRMQGRLEIGVDTPEGLELSGTHYLNGRKFQLVRTRGKELTVEESSRPDSRPSDAEPSEFAPLPPEEAPQTGSVSRKARIRGRWFFIHGVRRSQRITVRYFQGGLPRWRYLYDGGETKIGKHYLQYSRD
ncbi:MAG: VWA domain-containing protein [Fimbriimonadales bacterium]|nr:VWA domain-containing protein [Fimbriimonadales bacterium]